MGFCSLWFGLFSINGIFFPFVLIIQGFYIFILYLITLPISLIIFKKNYQPLGFSEYIKYLEENKIIIASLSIYKVTLFLNASAKTGNYHCERTS